MPLDAGEREKGGWLLTGMKETKKEERAFFHQASFDLCVGCIRWTLRKLWKRLFIMES